MIELGLFVYEKNILRAARVSFLIDSFILNFVQKRIVLFHFIYDPSR
jgi:hypothetical protein